MDRQFRSSGSLAAAITKSASRQTYYTIRFLVDRDRVADAFRAYGYFRWVDDVIDGEAGSGAERIAFTRRQKSLLDSCYRNEAFQEPCPEERMLVDLIHDDHENYSGLQIYLRNMMDVMIFDAERRDRLVSQAELSEYTHKLATAVTEAMYYFIGHDDPSPCHEARYMAVIAAHITHMLRDSLEDVEAGYFNVPREVLAQRGISPKDVDSDPYREWVCGRVKLARGYFKAARACTAQVRNLRCRLAGYAYTARFEWMLDAIEKDHYCLRCEYPERKSLQAGMSMAWSALKAFITLPALKISHKLAFQSVRIGKQ
jgi:phytoene/squalene synthetase